MLYILPLFYFVKLLYNKNIKYTAVNKMEILIFAFFHPRRIRFARRFLFIK